MNNARAENAGNGLEKTISRPDGDPVHGRCYDGWNRTDKLELACAESTLSFLLTEVMYKKVQDRIKPEIGSRSPFKVLGFGNDEKYKEIKPNVSCLSPPLIYNKSKLYVQIDEICSCTPTGGLEMLQIKPYNLVCHR